MRMKQDAFFSQKKILVIDSDAKNKNDRTWCFWEINPGVFENIVYKKWQQIDFYSNDFSGRWDIAPYTYKMIRGSDLYAYAINELKNCPNVVFLQEKVITLYTEGDRAFVKTASAVYEAQYVFNSIIANPQQFKTKGSLLQHFKGWMIETEDDRFKPDVATFMDFRLRPPTENTFVYVLPITERKALVEYTVFSPSLLEPELYEEGLRTYINNYLRINNYTVTEEEFGVIPMSTFAFIPKRSAIVHIGTAGDQTKSSSGYTFQFIQKHSEKIATALVAKEHPGKTNNLLNKRFKVYDDTLLHVLYNKTLTASQIFSDLFKGNKPQRLFRFLDNESTIQEELQVMSSVPSTVFIPAAWKQFSFRNNMM